MSRDDTEFLAVIHKLSHGADLLVEGLAGTIAKSYGGEATISTTTLESIMSMVIIQKQAINKLVEENATIKDLVEEAVAKHQK
jgi:hypothetical protein